MVVLQARQAPRCSLAQHAGRSPAGSITQAWEDVHLKYGLRGSVMRCRVMGQQQHSQDQSGAWPYDTQCLRITLPVTLTLVMKPDYHNIGAHLPVGLGGLLGEALRSARGWRKKPVQNAASAWRRWHAHHPHDRKGPAEELSPQRSLKTVLGFAAGASTCGFEGCILSLPEAGDGHGLQMSKQMAKHHGAPCDTTSQLIAPPGLP